MLRYFENVLIIASFLYTKYSTTQSTGKTVQQNLYTVANSSALRCQMKTNTVIPVLEFTPEVLCMFTEISNVVAETTLINDIAILTTEDNNLQPMLNNCRNIEKSYSILEMPKMFTTIYIKSSINRLEQVKNHVVLVFFDETETAKLIDVCTSSEVCKEYNILWIFIHFSRILTFRTTGLPLFITVQKKSARKDCGFIQQLNVNNSDLFTLYAHNGETVALGEISSSKEFNLNLTELFHLYMKTPKNQHKKLVRVVSIIEPPFTAIHTRSSEVYNEHLGKCYIGIICWQYGTINGKKTMRPYCCIGYLIELLETIAEELNLYVYLYIVEDGTYGEMNNGSWSGMIGDLIEDKADLAVASLTISMTRAAFVDFTAPFIMGGMNLVTTLHQKPIPFVNIKPFKSLTLSMWLLTLSVVFVAFTVTLCIGHKKGKEKIDWFSLLNHFVGFLFQRDVGGKIPFHLGTGVISVTVAISLLIIMSTYTAVLTAKTVTHTKSLAASGFNDRKVTHPTKAFKYGTLKNSAYSQFFRDNNAKYRRRMHEFMKDYDFTDTDYAFQQLQNGTLDAIIHDYWIAYNYIAKDNECNIVIAGKPIIDAGSGFALKKNSTLTLPLTRLLLKYEAKDELTKRRDKWFVNKCIGKENKGSVTRMGVTYFGSTVIILLGVVVFAIIVLMFEVFLRRRNLVR